MALCYILNMLQTKRRQGFITWKPRSFTGLMGLYEANYRRLKRLLGGILPAPGERLVSRSPGDMDLHICGIEQTPYTTVFRMTYRFEGEADGDEQPGLIIRLYHDAHMAEVLSCDMGLPAGTELERRWSCNLLLEKWLAYCHLNRHRFGPVRIQLVDAPQSGLR